MSPSRVSRRAVWRNFVTVSLVLSAVLIVSPAGAVTVTTGVLGGFEQEGNQAVGDFGGTLDCSTGWTVTSSCSTTSLAA